ncbi:MAG TPA: NAD(P)H-quinone oxidoreductase [Candidatus Margulisiibacteriota bacterium]|nr:NAD(P)H-quinone oxidoreductase [Candidatus Margulisiibacteriota bacterium]
MKAIVVDTPGAEDVLKIGEAPSPILGPEDIRIRVRATAVNRADLLQRQGMYPPPPGTSPIIGLECAGDVVEVGRAVRGWNVGERAMALLPGGGYAEEAVVHYGSAMHVPAALSFEEAGALPEVFLTSFLNIFMLGEIPAGGAALVHGGGSGVGTAAITLLKAAGMRALVTAGSDEKCQRCRAHGADVAINYRASDFAPQVREATGGTGVNVVLDSIGGKYLAANLECLALDGRLVIIGLIGGAKADINLAMLLLRRLRVIGSTLRTRSAADKAAIVSHFVERFGDALNAGRIKPVIDRVLPLEQAAAAHRVVQSSVHFGKVVLRV